MDAKDLDLLIYLNNQGRLDSTALSAHIGITPQNVDRRINLMKKEGIIKGFSAFFDRRMFGYDTSFLKLHFDIGEIDPVLDEISAMPQVASIYPNMDDFMLVEVVHWDQASLKAAIGALERIVTPYTVSAHFSPMLPQEIPETPKGKEKKLLSFLVKDGRADISLLSDLISMDEDRTGEMISELLNTKQVKIKPLVQEDMISPFPTFSIIIKLKEECRLDSCFSTLRKLARESWDALPMEHPQGVWMKCFGKDLHAIDNMLERFRRMKEIGEVMVVLPDTVFFNRKVDLNMINRSDNGPR